VNGVPTTHYHAVVDLNRVVSTASPERRAAVQQYEQILKRATGSSTLPIDVWIDARQHVRRMNLQQQLCIPGGKLSTSITFDILRYGSQPAVRIPPPSQVTDITDRLQAQTSQALQQLKC
jgi:hypothetical protein